MYRRRRAAAWRQSGWRRARRVTRSCDSNWTRRTARCRLSRRSTKSTSTSSTSRYTNQLKLQFYFFFKKSAEKIIFIVVVTTIEFHCWNYICWWNLFVAFRWGNTNNYTHNNVGLWFSIVAVTTMNTIVGDESNNCCWRQFLIPADVSYSVAKIWQQWK